MAEAERLVTPGEDDHELELVARDTGRAIVHALLDVASAVRAQTAAIERNAPRSPAEPSW